MHEDTNGDRAGKEGFNEKEETHRSIVVVLPSSIEISLFSPESSPTSPMSHGEFPEFPTEFPDSLLPRKLPKFPDERGKREVCVAGDNLPDFAVRKFPEIPPEFERPERGEIIWVLLLVVGGGREDRGVSEEEEREREDGKLEGG
mmetsp:Transcript_3733/g.6496  ORF Transcript_3733/g.6496 Transcript_3733/m.6496 type:complete len:145 (-) Transcript_3733:1937-2371(-)